MAGAILTAGFWIASTTGMAGGMHHMRLRASGSMFVAFVFDIVSIAAIVKWSFF